MSETSTTATEPFPHREAVRAAILALAETPQKLAALKKAAKEAIPGAKPKEKKAAEGVLEEMIAAGQLHPQGAAKTAPYAKDPPPLKNDPDKVRAALLDAAATPQTLTNLIKAATAATKADKAFVTAEANSLVVAEQLHKQSTAKTAPFGREKPIPPHPLEVGKAKKDFDKLVVATQKFLGSVPGVPATEVLDRLLTALAESTPPAPLPPPAVPSQQAALVPDVELTPSAIGIVERAPAVTAPPPVAPEPTPQLTPERIRTGLKAAYDELCLDPDFEDKLVEIRRLYHEAKRGIPELTVEQFHHELEHLQGQRTVELQPLNEVQRAQETNLALRHGDRLLYYVMWR